MEQIVINLFGGPGTGKCFRKGTKVLMYDGSIKKVEDVNKNDLVMGPDSKPRKVISLNTGIDKMYEIKPVKGESHFVTENHILPLKFNHHKKEKLELYSVKEYLKLSDWKKGRLKLFRANTINFKEVEVPIDPYFIGYWLGDGTSANQSITTEDKEIVRYLNTLANEFNVGLSKVTKSDTKVCRYNLTNGLYTGGRPNKILNILRKLDLINNKHIPDLYKINNEDERLQLLAGLIDSDGHNTNNCFEITSKYTQLTNDILYLCRSLGFSVYKKEKTVNNKVYYRMHICGDTNRIPTKLKRKTASKRLQIKNVRRTGFSVSYVGKEEFFGFEVNNDHMFLLDDFTVTHNSTTAAGVFALLKLNGVKAELVTEFAKDLTWEERWKTLDNQLYITAKQYHRLWRLNKVDVIITDSPLIQGLLYGPFEPFVEKMVEETYNSFNNHNIFLKRVKKYEELGRSQSEAEAKEMDKKILTLLDNQNITYETLNANDLAINAITQNILGMSDEMPHESKYVIEDVEKLPNSPVTVN